jgi:uncharacterized membrane protein
MAFCTQCGAQIGDRDQFCAVCGARQTASATPPPPPQPPPPPRPQPGSDFLGNITPQTAAVLCYIPIVGWIPSLFVLASNQYRGDRELRFHAFQGLYLWVAWMLADWVLGPFVRVSGLFFSAGMIVKVVKLTVFAAWIWMLVKVSQREMFRLPLIGELAEKSVAEQRF